MFLNLRRVHKCRCARLLTTGVLLCVLTACWEPLEHHVVSHVRSYSYRYLVNSYDFLSAFSRRSAGGRGGRLNRSADYPYLINHPRKCAGEDGRGHDDVLLLMFVKSSPENAERRQAIRDTWGDEGFVSSRLGATVRLAFAVGVHPDAGRRAGVQRALLREDGVHGDLIQQDFADTFHNLTAKLVLQFHWSQTYCPRARFLMSADDDVFVHTPNLVRYLLGLLGAGGLWVGHVHKGAPPVRRENSKYHVPRELYPWPSYPDYTAGAGYVVSGDVAAKIYRATLLLDPAMYIDDVFMGMCAKAMGLAPREHAYFSGEGRAPEHPCIYDRMITSHGHAADMRRLWREAMGRAAGGGPRGILGKLYCVAVRAALLCLPTQRDTYSCRAAFT